MGEGVRQESGLRERVADRGAPASMRPRTPCALALSLTTALAVLCVLATPALAARGHEFAGAFGWGVSSGASELQRCGATPVPESEPLSNCLPGSKGSGEGQFDTPNAIAVNESTGDVYVLDAGNDRVEIFNAQGTKFEGEFNGSGTLKNEEGKAAGGGGGAEEVPSGKFDEPNAIAIDNAPSSPSFGDVYVADTRGHKGGTFEEARMVIDKFDLTGKYIGQITRNPNGEAFSNEGFSELFGVAVDSSGQVWVEEQNFGSSPEGAAHYTSEEHNEWINFLSTESSNARHPGPGLAVDSEDDLYVHNLSFLDRLSKYKSAVAGTTAELIAGEVDEEAPTGVAVEGGSDDVYIAHAQNVHRVGPAGASLERLKAPGVPSFSAVAVNASSSILTVYVADAANNRIDLFTPEAPSTPKVLEGSEGVANVTATSADFSAEVNPRSEASEAPTSYSFKYGPCGTPSTCSSSPYTQSIPVPEGSLAPNYEPDPVSAHPQDLSPHTTYHMRLEAHNSHGAAKPGEELVFSTQTPGPPSSPDNRRYELVSPPDKHGASISARGQSGAGLIQAAAGGGAISYSANAPTEASPAGFSQTVEVLSRRSPASWASQDIATPHEALVGFNNGSNGEYPFFTEDLSSAVVGPNGPFTKALSSQASERTLYLRSNFPPGDSSHPCGSSCYRPLVVGCPGGGEPCPAAVQEAANVPEGTKFGEEGTCEENCGPFFLGASPDASHVLLSAHAKLTEDAPAEELGGSSLYEWSAGQLALVSVLPSGQAVAPSALPALGFLGEGSGGRIARHAISSDGQRVVFSAGELDSFKHPTGAHRLYLRRMSGEARTIRLDTPEAACTAKGKCTGISNPVFQTASADDSRVFFTDSQPLTQGSSQSPGNSDLYECQIEEGEEEEPPRCKLSDLTPQTGGGEGAGVLGIAAGAAEDGSAIYFTANGSLSEGANARGEEALSGDCKASTTGVSPESETAPERCNLYVRSAGQTRLVAVLSGADFPDWSFGGGLSGIANRVSPGGRYLAFMSRRSLSGYDNRDAVSGKPDEEVFLYDAQANGGQGGLVCASCDPSGGRPRGVQFAKIDTAEGGLSGGGQSWPKGAWIAASIPGWSAVSSIQGLALRQSRYLSDSGRLFFNAADSLVPEDVNRNEDVYEYEPPSVGDCSSEKSTFGAASGGCVALISSGTAKEESAFMEASESGDDAFFLTAQRLLPNQDVDASLDVYDAHACSAASPCLPEAPAPLPACEGDACQSPGAPPEDQTPSSLTYHGPGNPAPPAAIKAPRKTPAQIKAEKLKAALKACHKLKSKRKRSACEAKARKLYGAHKLKKSKKASRGKKR